MPQGGRDSKPLPAPHADGSCSNERLPCISFPQRRRERTTEGNKWVLFHLFSLISRTLGWVVAWAVAWGGEQRCRGRGKGGMEGEKRTTDLRVSLFCLHERAGSLRAGPQTLLRHGCSTRFSLISLILSPLALLHRFLGVLQCIWTSMRII